MLTAEQYDHALQQIELDREAAHTNELATLEDKVWTEMMVASRHALLYRRFLALSGVERNYSYRLAGEPGRNIAAERARVRASQLMDTADRHREASEQAYEEAQKLRQEAQGMQQQQSQNNNKPTPRRQRPQRSANPAEQRAAPRRPAPAPSGDA